MNVFNKDKGIFLFFLFITGCTSNGYYKNEITQNPCIENTNTSCTNKNLIKTEKYTLGFIEIDEQGNLHNKAQVDSVLKLLEKNNDSDNHQKKYVIIYVHGWHHNASEDDENVSEFKKRLEITKSRHEEMDVVGVYIGWRGKSISIPPFKYLTFWDRKSVSEEVGRNALTGVLLQLETTIKDKHPENILLTVGHSFGSSVVFNALHQIILQRLIQSKNKKNRLGFGDLVVLINPAFEAMRFTPIFETAQGLVFEKTQKPLMLITTSESDYATKIAFPIARMLNTLFESHKSFIPTNRNEKVIAPAASEWSLDITAVGHFDDYITHLLEANKSAGKDYTCPQNSGWLSTAVERQQKIQISEGELPTGEGWDTGNSKLKSLPPLFDDPSVMQLIHLRKSSAYNPYWIIKAHENVIPDHSLITQKHFWCFVDSTIDSVLQQPTDSE